MAKELFPIQSRGGRLFVPWTIGVEAWNRYSEEHGEDQSVEVIAQRGGFHDEEIVGGERL